MGGRVCVCVCVKAAAGRKRERTEGRRAAGAQPVPLVWKPVCGFQQQQRDWEQFVFTRHRQQLRGILFVDVRKFATVSSDQNVRQRIVRMVANEEQKRAGVSFLHLQRSHWKMENLLGRVVFQSNADVPPHVFPSDRLNLSGVVAILGL